MTNEILSFNSGKELVTILSQSSYIFGLIWHILSFWYCFDWKARTSYKPITFNALQNLDQGIQIHSSKGEWEFSFKLSAKRIQLAKKIFLLVVVGISDQLQTKNELFEFIPPFKWISILRNVQELSANS